MIIEKNAPFARETEKMNMHISEIAYAYLDRDWKCPNGKAAYTRVYYVKSGRGELRYDGKTLSLLPGNVYVIPAGLEYSYNCEDSLEKLYCHVNIFCYNRRDLTEDMRAPIVLRERKEDITRAIACWRAGDVMSALQLKELLYRTLCEAIEQSGTGGGEVRTYSPLIKQAVKYVEKNLRADLTATQMAEALFVSDSRLQKTFRAEMGVPLGRYITHRVLAVAEEQLRLTRRTIREISDSLGFCDRFYFSRMFRARYGVAPAQYRKNVSP